MGKIFYVIGKSSSGKDTIYRELIEKKELNLKQLILYTTRPIRSGEEDGVEYFFVTESKFNKMKEEGLVIESRAYNTAHGKWIYFTANDGQITLNYKIGYLATGTIASYVSTKDYYGEENVIPIYIELEDGIRLQRALEREKKQKEPKYIEMCRRFLADAKDFSEEEIQKANIQKKFCNEDLTHCVSEIIDYISECML
jgi:guanylate kinase